MAKKGWAGGTAPAQGAADSPHFGSDIIGKGFAWGVKNQMCASRSASKTPGSSYGKDPGETPRATPGYTKPHGRG